MKTIISVCAVLLKQSRFVIFGGALAISMVTDAQAQVAVTANPFAPSQFSLGLGRTAGWRFVVQENMAVTHLGLYDWQGNGLSMNYQVGLWDSNGNLLTSNVVPSGAAAQYISGFRYSTTATAFLNPNEVYTVGYYQSVLADADRAIYFEGFHTTDPLISQVGSAVVSEFFEQMNRPDQPWVTGFPYWIGPSFQYTIVPAPSAGIALCAAMLLGRQRRRAK